MNRPIDGTTLVVTGVLYQESQTCQGDGTYEADIVDDDGVFEIANVDWLGATS